MRYLDIVTPAAYDRVRKLYYEDYAFIDSLACSQHIRGLC